MNAEAHPGAGGSVSAGRVPVERDRPDAPARPVKVSVVVVSYNQAEELREGLESVVSQRTDFPFEVVVLDDGSDDGSADVAREYAARHPGLVRARCRERNLGTYRTLVEAHNLARGEYVAHLDGDDLFFPGKLQRQADFLDAHPEVSVVWHAVRLIDAEGRAFGRATLRREFAPDGYFRLEDALEVGSVGVHSAQMYRASARTTRAPEVDTIDWFYAVEYLRRGLGYEIAEELGAYRRAPTNSSVDPSRAQRMRRCAFDQIGWYGRALPGHRRELFTLALLVTLADLRTGRPSPRAAARTLWATRAFVSPGRLLRAYRRFRTASREFRGGT